MTFNEAQAEFALRYYRWAREQFRCEVEQDFPMLKRLNTRPSRACLHWMAQLTPVNQLKFADALAKRFHKQALQITGEALGDWETEMIKRYTDLPIRPFHEDEPAMTPAALNLRRRNMATLVKKHLAPVFQQTPKNAGGGVLRYTNPIGRLQLETHLDFGGRSRLVEYSHNIVFTRYFFLVQFASVQSWLGLAGATSWSDTDLSESEAEGTAQLIAEVCEFFLRASPKLVEGISV